MKRTWSNSDVDVGSEAIKKAYQMKAPKLQRNELNIVQRISLRKRRDFVRCSTHSEVRSR